MALFAVLADKANPELGSRIAELYPSDFYKLSESQWIVSADAIAQTVAENIDVRTGKYGRVIVLGLSGSSSGWHSKTVWEWLTQKRAAA